MFGSNILEIALALTCIYLILALFCSMVQELIASWLGWRASTLKDGIRAILQDRNGNGLAGALYRHPLTEGQASLGKGMPSYIPAELFSTVLVDLLIPSGEAPQSFNQLRQSVLSLSQPELRRSLLPLLDRGEANLESARLRLEQWFNQSMDRVSGWYKRRSQMCIFISAGVLVLLLNADSIKIIRTLWTDLPLRQALVAQAEGFSANTQGMPSHDVIIKTVGTFPLGWNNPFSIVTDSGLSSSNYTFSERVPILFKLFWLLLLKVLGLVITVFAVSLGAPFWFDLMGRIVKLRASGVKPSPESGSDARQPIKT